METPYAEQADIIKGLIKNIVRSSRNVVLTEVKNFDLTIPQLQALHELYHHPDITLTELSERLCLAKSTVCGIIERLEHQEVVVKTRDSQDRRLTRLSLAPKVLKMQEAANLVQKNYLAGVLQELSDQDIKEIISALTKLNQAMQVYL